MSDNLRDALEKLVDKWQYSDGKGFRGFYEDVGSLLAAHPVEPAPDICVVCGGSGFAAPSVPCGDSWHDAEDATDLAEPAGVSDEAVEAARRAREDVVRSIDRASDGTDWPDPMRAALEAALPFLQAQSVDREALAKAILKGWFGGDAYQTPSDCRRALDAADAVLALIGGG